MRIRGAKTELEEAGLETEGMVSSTAKLREEIMALSGVDIMLNNNEFKSTYQIMDELAERWQDLSDIQQATVTELIAGKRQGNIVSSLMNNFDIAEQALQTSLDSSGSAMKEHEKWQESLEARLLKLKAAWQSLSQTFMESDFLKVGIDLIIEFVGVLDNLIKHLGSLGTIGFGASIFGLVKNRNSISGILSTLSSYGSLISDVWASGGKLSSRFKEIGTAAGMAGKDISQGLTKSLSGTVGAIGIAVAAIGLVVNAYKNYKEEISKARQETIESSESFLESASSFEQAYIKYSGKSSLTADEEAELSSAIQGTVDALDDKSNALQGIVNNSNDYLKSLEQIANEELKAADRAAKNKRDAAELELKDTVKGWSSFDGSEVDIDLGTGKTGKADAQAINIANEMNSKFVDSIIRKNGNKGIISLSADADVSEIIDYYNFLLKYQEQLSNADLIDTDAYDKVSTVIDKMSDAIDTYTNGVYDAAKAQYQLNNGIPKTTEEYLKMRESILNSKDIKNLSLDAKNILIDTLDSEYSKVFDLSTAEVQARKFVGLIKGYGNGAVDGTNEIGTVETYLNMRTAVNNNECTVGQYLSEFDKINAMTAGWDDNEKELFNTSFGLDTDAIKEQYKNVYNYISRNYLSKLNTAGMRPFDAQEYKNYEQERIKSLLNSLTASELNALVSIKGEIDWENTSTDKILEQIQKEADLIEALNFETNIEIDTTALETLNTALEESVSAMGLTTESIDSLKAKYSDLDSYDAGTLFEKTANGVKVNREELAKLEKEQNDLKKAEIKKHIETLTKAYNENASEIDKCTNASKRAQLIAENESYKNQIEDLSQYQAQLEGVTGAYQRWLNAQDTPEDYEGYELVATSREDIKDEIGRGFISNASKEYIDLLSGKDLQGGTIDDYANAWKKLDDKVTGAGHSINDFFTVNDDGDITAKGIDRFFKSLQTDFKGSVAKFNKDAGKWEYDFSQENLKKIQDEWGIGIEAIELLLEAAASAGYDVDWGGILDGIDLDTSNFETLVSYAELMQTTLKEIDGFENIDFNFTATGVEEAESEIEKARQAFSKFINTDGTVNLEADGAEEMQFILTTLIIQKQQLSTPAIMKVDTSQIDQAKEDVIGVINAAQTLQTAYENYEIAISTGVDVEKAKTDLNTAIEGMKGTSVDVRADLKLPTNEELEAAKGSIGDIKVGATLDDTAISSMASKIQTECTPNIIAKVTGIDETAITNGEGGRKVKYTPEHSEVDTYINSLKDINKKIIFKYTTEGTKPNPKNIERTITYKYETEGESPAAGTAHANGSASGRAFAHGNWGIKGNGVALGGELGRELVVRDGRFFTIGDNGAEFFKYQKNDIVFNAAQTESLFKYGGIKGAKPRGKMLASGSAFVNGSYPSVGRAYGWEADASESNFAKNRITGKSYGSKNNGKSSSSDKDFEEIIDWIEVIIDRVERAIDKFDQQANNIYKSWSSRNKALINEISKVEEEIVLQQKAYNKYMEAANGVGLSSSYAEKVRNGKIDIETITNETLAEKIKDYQNWYEKALDCKKAIDDLKETESELYKQRFENVSTQYEGILSVIEHEKNMLDEYVSQSEANAMLVSENYYKALSNNEKDNIAQLEKQKAAMLAELKVVMESGTVTKGSEAWYSMVNDIDAVTLAIEEGKTQLLEYEQTLQQLDWERFDLLQEKISAITEESEFLIDLLSSEKLYDDNGQLTDSGMATMGLHGQNYNVYMAQADQAAAEAERIRKQMEQDPFDTELEKRYREMISLQQEHILAAQDEKEAIRDMVEEGIELELDALQERIDKYNEALDSQKDLYDYQKRVKEQTEEIASLEKQMAAYAGDTSEETKAKVQELKVSLEEAKADLQETEYEKYISDQQQLLDDLYEQYSEILNARLDNLDALIGDMITEINTNASTISATLSEKADAVGYNLSESMTTIWDTNSTKINSVITTYGEKFSTAQTTTNNALSTINTNLQNMIMQLNKIAKTNVKSASISSAANSKEANAIKKVTATKTEAKKPTTSTNKEIKVGGKINAGSAKIYDYAGDKSGETQYYKKDPVYVVLAEKNGYLKVRYHKLKSGTTGWFKKSDVKAYATGKKDFLDDEIAWTQEKGREFIVRPSDGAILTPVAKGDSVLNAHASNNIWDMANSPADFIRDNLNLGSNNVPNNSSVQNSYTQNLDKIVFNLPNVKNYDELLSAMQKDKNFEKLILSMSIDKLAGKSSLAKNKSIR